MWQSNGTEDGTTQIENITSTFGLNAILFNHQLFFSAVGENISRELHTIISNDEPENSIPLEISSSCNPIIASNFGATYSRGFDRRNKPTNEVIPVFDCTQVGDTLDVWFSATIPSSGNLTIETSEIEGGLTDLAIEVYENIGCYYLQIECDDNSGLENQAKIILSGIKPGRKILIRVVDFQSNESGEFGICAYVSGCNCENNPTSIIDFNPNANWLQPNNDFVFENDTLTVYQECLNVFDGNFFKSEDIRISSSCNNYLNNDFKKLSLPFVLNKWKIDWELVDGCGNKETKSIIVDGKFDCAFIRCEDVLLLNDTVILFTKDTLFFNEHGDGSFRGRIDSSNIGCFSFPTIDNTSVVKRRRRGRNLNPICNEIDAKCYGEDFYLEITRNDGTKDTIGEIVLGIYDSIPPTITTPNDTTIACTAEISTVNTRNYTASDNCEIYMVNYTDDTSPPFDFNNGDVIVNRTWTAIDSFGNKTNAIQQITLLAEDCQIITTSGNCQSSKMELDGIADAATYQAQDSIYSTATINHGGNTSYMAGEVIILTGGFQVTEGSEFTASIMPCENLQTEDIPIKQTIKHKDIIQTKDLNLQFFPNPASQELTINYQLPETGKIILEIYNYNGALSHTIRKGEILSNGFQQERWQIPSGFSGVYYIVLRTEKEIAVEKLSIIQP